MAHCYRGPGANSFGGVGQQIPPERDALHDLQTALEQWVEQGVAPDQLIATKYVDDEADTTGVEFTRKLYPYPGCGTVPSWGSRILARRSFTWVVNPSGPPPTVRSTRPVNPYTKWPLQASVTPAR